MNPDQYKKISELMAELEALHPEEREEFLQNISSSVDPFVLKEVRDLQRFASPDPVRLSSTRRFISGPKLPGNPRFTLGRRLGSGAFGEVYEATDNLRNMAVAIKILRQTDLDRLRRFRQEFRRLAGVSHPNLVKLFQLFYEEQWFFTMELIEGTDFLRFVRPETASPDLRVLSRALLQLAEGIEALHRRDLLHRDIKPSNVLVTSQGRVALLDFGLVKDLGDQSTQQTIAGTPDFMAPEQFTHAPITEAADWYAFGVMMYQAITGHLPFRGTLPEIIAKKSAVSPELPAKIQASIPDLLAALCHRLLSTDPHQRPKAEEIYRVLAPFAEREAAVPEKKHVPSRSIVGRSKHFRRLHCALEDIGKKGSMVAATLSGKSGMGKTTLAQAFCRQVREADSSAVILSGACYENELVPFKAIDGLIEGLNSYLRELPSAVCEAILPYDFRCLTKLFPALAFQLSVPVSVRHVDILDSQEIRKRAFSALMDLLARLAERKPVILFLDDLQWGDSDSAAFFRELFRAPTPPRLMFLGAFRTEDGEHSSFLQAYREHLLAAGPGVTRLEMDIQELSQAETLELTLQLQQSDEGRITAKQLQLILEDCGGCPLLIEFFASHAEHGLSLRDLVELRLNTFGGESKQLFHLIAVAGQPIAEKLLFSCIKLSQEEFHQGISALLEERLIRIHESAGIRMMDVYHARIRDAILAAMDPPLKKSLHLLLAESSADSSESDPAFLSVHFLSAGNQQRFTEQGVLAAERAFAALAFSRAVELYRQLIAHGYPGVEGFFPWRARLAQALINADLVIDGAETYAQCAQEAPPDAAAEMKRLAAQHYIRGGRLREGLTILRSLAQSVGLRLPEKPWLIWTEVAIIRIYVVLRGYNFREVEPAAVRAIQRTRLEVYWTLAGGYMAGMLAATLWNAKHLVLALSVGDPHHLALALAFEAAFSAFRGEGGYQKGLRFLRTASEIAIRHNDHHAMGMIRTVEAVTALVTGRWKQALERAEEGDRILREKCQGVAWELVTVRVFLLGAMGWLGDWKILASRFDSFRKDAEDRGNSYASTQLVLSTFSACGALCANQPEQAEQALRDAQNRWHKMDFDVPTFWGYFGMIYIMLYRGARDEAWVYLESIWPSMWRALHTNIACQIMVIAALHLRASCALVRLSPGSPPDLRSEMCRLAASCVVKIRSMDTSWGEGMASLADSGRLMHSGDYKEGMKALQQADTQFGLAGMEMYVAATRYIRGTLLRGEEGERLAADGERLLRDQGVQEPAFIARMLAPGFSDFVNT